MPELPDVEVLREYAGRTLMQKIEKVRVSKSRTLKVSGPTLTKNLKGSRFVSTARYGKYLFLETEDGCNLVLHFGMTGSLCYYQNEDPEHSPLIIDFENGSSLAYINVRKLGKIYLTREVGELVRKKNLGPDAWWVSEGEFLARMRKKRGQIKSALMDQSLFAGLGNVYTDEILYQAKIHPKSEIPEQREKLICMYKTMKKVLKTAIKCGGQSRKFPKYYLIRHREEGGECGICGGRIEKTKVGGRSSCFCGKHQKRGRVS
jgi:formamidopyrimidine-DNA glycosylase